MSISDYKIKDVPVSIIIITITHQNGDAWQGIDTVGTVCIYFNTKPVTSQPHYSLHLQQNGEKTLVWNLGMNWDVNSKYYL